MDELDEFCARLIGDRTAAAQAARRARQDAGPEPMRQLAAAIRLCRDDAGHGSAAPESPSSRVAPGRVPASLSDAVAAELAIASARLPQRQREALALRELLGLSHAEVAAVIGIEPAAVPPLLARSRLRLRSELRGSTEARSDCPERERMLRTATLRQDKEPGSEADDDWLLDHLGHCESCARAHAGMLEASACYRGWRAPQAALAGASADS